MHKKLTFSEFCGDSYETEVSHKFVEYLKLCFRAYPCPVIIYLFRLTDHLSKGISPALHTQSSSRHGSRAAPHCSSRRHSLIHSIGCPDSPSFTHPGIDWADSNSTQTSENCSTPHTCQQACYSKYHEPSRHNYSPSRSIPGALIQR